MLKRSCSSGAGCDEPEEATEDLKGLAFQIIARSLLDFCALLWLACVVIEDCLWQSQRFIEGSDWDVSLPEIAALRSYCCRFCLCWASAC